MRVRVRTCLPGVLCHAFTLARLRRYQPRADSEAVGVALGAFFLFFFRVCFKAMGQKSSDGRVEDPVAIIVASAAAAANREPPPPPQAASH